jgi:hypothetical protein
MLCQACEVQFGVEASKQLSLAMIETFFVPAVENPWNYAEASVKGFI